ncbi:MAG: fatty acid desaturase [Oligoflexus sp.]
MKTNRAESSTCYPSLQDINRLLPKHLREVDPWRSLWSLCTSSVLIFLSMAIGYYLLETFGFTSVWSYPLFFAYSFVIGTCLVGYWILAHECGHGSFIKPKWLEDSIGLILHTTCLIPYFAWARSHLLHHANHGHLEKDTAYVPVVDGSLKSRFIYQLPRRLLGQKFSNAVYILLAVFIGWPLYLLAGLTGGKFLGLNHFVPLTKKSFDPFPGWQLKLKVLVNTIVYAFWVCAIIQLLLSEHAVTVFWLYVLPLFWVNAWLIVYTFLHHTDDRSYWLDQKTWSFTEGAFSSIDRSYWSVTNFLHHNIGRYHVYHHLNSKIPHYHGKEATRLIQQAYPEFHRFDQTHPLRALWRAVGTAGVVAKKSDGRYHLTTACEPVKIFELMKTIKD